MSSLCLEACSTDACNRSVPSFALTIGFIGDLLLWCVRPRSPIGAVHSEMAPSCRDLPLVKAVVGLRRGIACRQHFRRHLTRKHSADNRKKVLCVGSMACPVTSIGSIDMAVATLQGAA